MKVLSESTGPAPHAAPEPTGAASASAVDAISQSLRIVGPPSAEDAARQRIASLEREARALGSDPSAALLFHEIGLLWEEPLKNLRNAAVAYQHAFRIAPRFVVNIQAARRLFSDVGNWQMVVQLLDAELAATSDASARAPLLFEKAVVLQTRLSRDDDAQRSLRMCLDARPRDLALLVQLEAHYEASPDHAALLEVYRLLAEALTDGAARAHYLMLAAELLQSRLNRPEEAAQALREAFALQRQDPLLVSAQVEAAEREGRDEELVAALSAEAELLGEHAAPTYLRLAHVFERMGKPDDALAALSTARRISPDEPLVLSELAQIYEGQGRHEELAEILLAWAERVPDETEKVALNLRLAALYEDTLKRPEAAVERYQAILQQVPGQRAALAGLGRLLHRFGQWEQLVAVYDQEVSAMPDPKDQAPRMFRAAEILEDRLGREDEAIARYILCLDLVPGYLPAQKALTRLYERGEKWSALAELYEQDLLQTQDRDDSVAILHKMAALYNERLNDPERAIECLRRVLEAQPEHLPTIRALGTLLERGGRWQELIALQAIEASLVGDMRQVIGLHHRNAEILEEEVADRAAAMAAWEGLLALSPAYVPALKALGRLYAEEGRWEDLARMYRAEAEIAPSSEQAAALVFRVGELYEQKLSDEAQAIAAYREVLTLSPGYVAALRALARIFRAGGAWENLIEVLRADAATRTDPAERANALYQAAAIWEARLERIDRAAEVYEEVLQLSPGHAAAIRALERLYANGADVKPLIAVLDRVTQTAPTQAARANAYVKLGHLYLDRLDEPSRAAKCAESALAIDAEHLSALKLLERVRAADRPRRGELRERIARRSTDEKLRQALLLAASADRDQPGAPAATTELYEAFLASPADVRLALSAERGLRAAGDFARLAIVLERRANVAGSPTEEAALLMRLGDAHVRAGAPALAVEAFRAAAEAVPGCSAALQSLRALHAQMGEWDQVRAVAEEEAKAARDPGTALDAWIAAGDAAAEKLGDKDAAIAAYRTALEHDPLDARAGAALARLLAERNANADLAAVHERRAEALLAQKKMVFAAEEFLAAARRHAAAGGDLERAWTAVDRALAAQPTHLDALELKADLALALERFADAAQALAVRVQQGGDAKRMSAFHLRLGALYQDRLRDLTRAAAHLQTSLAGDGSNVEALERLARLHTAARNWTGAADCLKRLVGMGGAPADEARRTVALADVLDQGLGDAEEAGALYRRALELVPGDSAALSRMVAISERNGNLPELARLLEAQVRQSPDPVKGNALRARVAELFAGPLNNPKGAIAHYSAIVESEPSNAKARAALADLFARDAATANLAVEEHRTILEGQPTRVESLRALVGLWRGSAPDRAFCAAGVLQFLRAANEAETAFAEQARARVPERVSAQLTEGDLTLLLHPALRNSPVLDVLRAIGDQLGRLYPPQLEALGVDRRADRLKQDHPAFQAVHAHAKVFAVDEFEVYQSRRGLVTLETTEPLSVCVSQDLIRKLGAREQAFLIGRAAFGLYARTAILARLSAGEVADLIGSSVRIFHPEWSGAGRRNDELVKQLRKAYSRKALRLLEAAAAELAGAGEVDAQGTVELIERSADRAGLVLCGDVGAALGMVFRESPDSAALRADSPEAVAQSVAARPDLRELVEFSVSDELFKLRQRCGLVV